MALLAARELVKRYGMHEAVKGISFQVEEGSCWGLLGPNGAGKSTTLGTISGSLEPTAGELYFAGRPWAEAEGERRRSIGYVPQDLALYEEISGLENLRFWGRVYGVAASRVEERAKEALGLVGLGDRGTGKVKSYSGGMKRRLNLAAAILHRPRLLLLDEPVVGVDPQSRNLLMSVLQELRRQGMTMIYTSHYMAEVEQICDRVAIIDHGQVLAEDTLAGLLARSESGVVLRTSQVAEVAGGPWHEWLPGAIVERQDDTLLFRAERPSELLPEVARRVVQGGWEMRGLEVVQPSLESVFLQLTGTALRDE